MNEAILPSVSSSLPPPAAPGVYADLHDLLRLRFKSGGISLLPAQPLTSVLAGRHGSRLRGRGLNFEEIRRYLPGDDIRQMDWKVTARTRSPHIRVYTEERGREVLLVVDQRLSMFFGSRKNFKSVTAAEVAALAAWRVLAAKDRVSAIVFGDTDLTLAASTGSPSGVMRLLSIIVGYNKALAIDRGIIPGLRMFNAALARAERLVSHDALVVVISDGQGSDTTTRAILNRMAAHNDVVVALVRDPLEARLPEAGNRVFASGGLQLEANTSDAKLRQAFREDFQNQLDKARRYLLQREVPLLPVSTASDAAPQIRKLLGTRVRR